MYQYEITTEVAVPAYEGTIWESAAINALKQYVWETRICPPTMDCMSDFRDARRNIARLKAELDSYGVEWMALLETIDEKCRAYRQAVAA